jgi:acyl-CoA thioester hydrolase
MKKESFPVFSSDKIRYSDTDRQGHVNNAVFATFLETGRVEILYNQNEPILLAGCSFVIASLSVNFIKEINWPGTVDIGTGVQHIGNSSIVLFQKLFQNGREVANASSTVVQVSDINSTSVQLSNEARKKLSNFILKK